MVKVENMWIYTQNNEQIVSYRWSVAIGSQKDVNQLHQILLQKHDLFFAYVCGFFFGAYKMFYL